jgi:small subunit ribosomal protein S1
MLSNTQGMGDTETSGAGVEVDTTSQIERAPTIDTSSDVPPAAPLSPDLPPETVLTDAASVPVDPSTVEVPTTETAAVETPAIEMHPPETSVDEHPPVETTTAPQPTPEGVPAPSGIRRGDVIEGTIIATSPTAITVDVGNGRTGTISSHELERLGRRALEELKVGEPITVYVINPRTVNGEVALSINRAAEEIDWQRAESARQNQEPYETKVAGYNKGGLIVRFGRVRGFVPLSQMSPDRRRRATGGETPEESLGAMVNEPIVVKVMEVDRQRNRLILSERTATRENREKRKESLISQLTVGEVRMGRVVSLEDFGAFIDIGGAEGLVHLTELSWKHITRPQDILKEGQEVQVEVISIDPDAKRIGLSMRRREPDPWDTVAINFAQGQLVKGEITKLTKFGAFARLVDLPEIEGLVHISELSDKRVAHPREVVKEGDVLTLRVVKVDVKGRRLGLSLKRVQSKEYLDMDWGDMGGA